MTNNFFSGMKHFSKGFSLILVPGLRKFVIVPLSLNILLFVGLIWFGYDQFSIFVDWLIPDFLSFLTFLLWPLFALVTMLFIFYTFTIFANLIGAPFNSLLAEATEEYLTHHKITTTLSTSEIIKNLPRTIGAELRKYLYFLKLLIPLIIISLIPGINLIAAPLWFLFNAWVLVIEYADYPMGNHEILFPKQREKLKLIRFTSLGFGSLSAIVTMIPFVNFIAMPVSVTGATHMWVNQWKDSETT